ncbi:MAG: 50S ribosomal protein L15 [Planctomycetota bacterium]
MQLHQARRADLSNKKKVRVGRGPASGLGKTAGRGIKGATSRSGYAMKVTYEGGQMPIFRRLPKRGFRNGRFKVTFVAVNVGDLSVFAAGSTVGLKELKEKGLAHGVKLPTGGARSDEKIAHRKAKNIAQEKPEAVEQKEPRNLRRPVKVLGEGELSVALHVTADAFSKSAIEKIQKAGGTVTWINGAPKKKAPNFKKIDADKKLADKLAAIKKPAAAPDAEKK